MDKDEILARSRKENKDRDLVDMEAANNANAHAFTAGVLISSLLSVLHAIFLDSVDYGCWTVMFVMMATIMLVKFSKLRKRHELLLGLGYLGLSIFFFVFYLRGVLGVF